MLTYKMLEPKIQKWEFDNFECLTIPVAHNVPNWCIVIKSKMTGEKLCYATDFCSMPRIEGINYWIYEVNYIEAYIEQMIEENKELKHTNFNNHNSLENAVEYFNTLKTRPKEIVCAHLSASNSIKSRILEAMQPFADKVSIAETWRK